jgi:hypothetical protein
MSACLHVCMSACLRVCMSACLHVCMSACQPVCLSACLPVCLPVCLPAFLPVILSARLPFCLSACLPACQPCFLNTIKWTNLQKEKRTFRVKELIRNGRSIHPFAGSNLFPGILVPALAISHRVDSGTTKRRPRRRIIGA